MAFEYSAKQFKKVVNVTNEVSEECTVNYPDDIAKHSIMLFLARVEGMIKTYKSHAFSDYDLDIYNLLLSASYKSAETAYRAKVVIVSKDSSGTKTKEISEVRIS